MGQGERATGLVVAAVALALSAAAPANADHGATAVETFEVNSTGSAADAGINGDCDTDATSDDDCTLAAAIAEANAHDEGGAGARDAITFNTFDEPGDPDDVAFAPSASDAAVTIGGALPTITDGVAIATANCAPLPAVEAAPCATLETGLVIDAVGEVRVSGFAFSAVGTGVRVTEVTGESAAIPDFQLHNSFFGVEKTGVRGSAVPPGTGVLLEDVAGAEIGGITSSEKNLFARQGTGIDVFGADGTRILGNEFGVLADGSFARAGENASSNGDNIEITGDDNGSGQTADDDPAIGTEVGARSAADAGTPACDGSCNLITRAGISEGAAPQFRAGIDLGGEPGENELPAADTVIRGNEVGGGAGTGGRNSIGIAVGGADGTEIGGPAVGGADRNVIAGNEVQSGAGATELVIDGNLIGLGATGNTVLSGTSLMLNLDGSGSVLGNRLASGATQPVVLLKGTAAPGFEVRGNVFGELANGGPAGAGLHGVQITGNGHEVGGPAAGDGNVFSTSPGGATTGVGIRITGDDNRVVGNRIGVGSAGQARPLHTGIVLDEDADGNLIGGDDAGSENLISNSSFDAIRVTNANSDGNLIARNRGNANGDLFIDLGGDGAGNLAEPGGPNGGAQAPQIAAAETTTAQGTAAPGALVRVFGKATGSPGELEAFLGQATADGTGNWQAAIPEQPAGRLIAATATIASGTSEVSAPAPVQAPAPGSGGTGGGAESGGDGGAGTAGEGGGGGAGPDTDPPETTIGKRPKNAITKPKASYSFSSDEAGSTFRCRLDRKPFKSCTSPRKLRRLDDGKHRFQVIAVDRAGNADPTPAKDGFKVG
ncbi:MAG TPA: hypothetical protein VFY99_04305 [Solirubrobacterales bacterium]